MHFGCNHDNSNNNSYIVNLFPAGPKCCQILLNICLHALPHTLTYTHAYMHALMNTSTHARTHAHTRMHARTHAHAHTHTHSHRYIRAMGLKKRFLRGEVFKEDLKELTEKKQRTTIINTLTLVLTSETAKEITLHYDNLHWTLHIHIIPFSMTLMHFEGHSNARKTKM